RKAAREQAVRLREVRQERAAVRAAGGSTPVLPFLRPKKPQTRLLKVACGACEHRFEVRQDPMVDTPLLCPKCGLLEVLPGIGSDPLAPPDVAVVPRVQVTCGACAQTFHAVRELRAHTALRCPHCGATDTLPPPAAAQEPDAGALASAA
ncbi:MAG TPA: hypothetical protein VFH47_04810, partial [Candidatus Thermoplasmatota archaeon]|nr:hypothetical protein [Candidatus Thermoplasmatota archaeon]